MEKDIMVTVPATKAREFQNGALARFIVDVTAHVGEGEQFTPKMVHMNDGTARAALGGKVSPQSFVAGLLYAASRHAYGQTIDVAGLPSWVRFAVTEVTALIKKGAGVTRGQLCDAVNVAMSKMLALPTPAKKKTADNATPIPSPTVLVHHVDVKQEHGNTSVIAAEKAHDAAWAQYGDELVAPHHAAIEAAIEAEKVNAFVAKQAQSKAQSLAFNLHIAQAEFSALAELLGVKLTKAQHAAIAAHVAAQDDAVKVETTLAAERMQARKSA